MSRRHPFAALWLGFLFLASCSRFFGSGSTAAGSVTISLPGSLNASSRAIVADFRAEVDSLSVTIFDGRGDSYGAEVADPESSASVTISGLYPGSCTVTVSAIKEGAVVGSGSASVELSEGEEATVTVPLSFSQSGSGDFSLAISWPASVAGLRERRHRSRGRRDIPDGHGEPERRFHDLLGHLLRARHSLRRARPGHHLPKRRRERDRRWLCARSIECLGRSPERSMARLIGQHERQPLLQRRRVIRLDPGPGRGHHHGRGGLRLRGRNPELRPGSVHRLWHRVHAPAERRRPVPQL